MWKRRLFVAFVCLLPSVAFAPGGDPVEVVIILRNGGTIKGEVLAVRDSSIVVSTVAAAKESELAYSAESFRVIGRAELQSVAVPGNSHLLIGAGMGAAGGLALGCATWEQKQPATVDDFVLDITGVSMFSRAATFGLVGCGAGGLVGAVLSRREQRMYLAPDSALAPLRKVARYNSGEPDFLKKVR